MPRLLLFPPTEPMKRVIAILAKEPTPGRVKTRLAKHVGAERAASFAKAFLLDTIDVALAVEDATVLVSYDPPTAEPWFRAHAPRGCQYKAQPPGDLGVRIQASLEWGFLRGAHACIAIGMDSPEIQPARLQDALDGCDGGSVTVGPSLDGGYYLIGTDRPRPSLFEGIPWSTDAVLPETLARVEAIGATPKRLPAERDVDEFDDLQALDLSRLGPHSRAALLASQLPPR